MHKPKRRLGLWITVCSLVVLAGAGVIGVGVLKPFDKIAAAPSPSAKAEPDPSPVLVALSGGQVPTPESLRKQIEALVTKSVLGSKVRVSIVDIATGQKLYERDPEKLATPASNTKIATAAAVLSKVGPEARITTKVVAGANPGEVVLVGGGDVTLGINAKQSFYEGSATLEKLAAQVLAGGKPTKVIVDGSLFTGPLLGPGWDKATPAEGYASQITALTVNGSRVDPRRRAAPPGWERFKDPELSAGQLFAAQLGLPASAVAKGKAPVDAKELATVQSAPMLRLIEQMLFASDNNLAEALARQVALASGKPASFAGASEAVNEILAGLGLPSGQFRFMDGSGMSSQNKISPTALTTLLTQASKSEGDVANLINVLPVSGWSGSMEKRFGKAHEAYGMVRAKSGTLDGTNALSGVVQTASGRLLAFSLLAEEVKVWQYPAQDALDEIVAAVATCGCP